MKKIDGKPIRLPSWYYNDEPYYIPIELAFENPELYAELVAKRKEFLDSVLGGIIAPSLKVGDKKIGKVMMCSTVTDEMDNDYKALWSKSTPEKGGEG